MRAPESRESLFFVVGPAVKVIGHEGRVLLRVTYPRDGAGRVSCWQGWSDARLSWAGGYGYDKTGTVLADALAKLWPAVPRIDGARGVEAVRRHYGEHGVRVHNAGDALWALPAPGGAS